ncbi:MAG: hypothetical protein ACXWQR_14780 [Ktedonobacterales bacterium]
MNDTRWSMTSILLFLGVVFLIGGSVICAAAAPDVLRDLAIIDFRHLLMHFEQGLALLGVAGGCIVGALALDGLGRQPTRRAPRAWNALWHVRSNPLNARVFSQSQRLREAVAQAGGPVSVRAHAVAYGGVEGVVAARDEVAASALGERVPALAMPAIRHGRVRGGG